MDKYLYLIKIRFLVSLQYRIEALGGLVSNLLPLLTIIFVWKNGFKTNMLINGVSQSQMITYSIIAFGLKDVFFFNVQDSLFNGARQGDVAIDLSRPYSLLGRYFAEDAALSISAIFRRFLPLAIFSSCFIQIPMPHTLVAGLLTLVSLGASFGILWTFSAIMGLFSFWTMELGNLGMVKDALVRILSGSIVPIWFFSDTVQWISKFLPFQYTYQTPLAIYIGQLSTRECLVPIMIQFMWFIVFFTLLRLLWIKAKRHLLIQGG